MALVFSTHLPVSVCGTDAEPIHAPFLASQHRPLRYSNFAPFRPGLPTPGTGYLKVSVRLTVLAATEYQPYVHRPVSYTHLDVYKRQGM